ncbi:hypothetical protein [Natronomonas sp. EA1]|uniref:hypothetical protein n=1 Tax=Natronomonas sp. EA1 TaxID=3421655 RepID=UPI003EBA6587
MNWTRPLVALITLGIIVWAIGSLVSLAIGPLSGPRATASIATLGLVAVSVIGMAVVGARSRRWLENPRSYW